MEFLKKMQLSCLFFLFNVGMGVNLANGEPTVSINEIILQYNKEHRTFLEPLTIEETIARTVNTIEELIEDFQVNGVAPFLKKYYNRWLHRCVEIVYRFNEFTEGREITRLIIFFLQTKFVC